MNLQVIQPDRLPPAGTSVASGQRTKLANVSNMGGHEGYSISMKEYIRKLQKENFELRKLLSEKKFMQMGGLELQKLRQQNTLLAQENRQILVELTSSKNRLKLLDHELGCKNALLNAIKVQSEVNLKESSQTNPNQYKTSGNKTGGIEHDEAPEPFPPTTNSRHQSNIKSSGNSSAELLQFEDNAYNKRLSQRRQSARFQSEEPETDRDVHEKRLSKRRQTAIFKSEASASANNLEVDHIKDNVETKRVTRRQSSRFETAEEESTVPEDIAENMANKRLSQRRQSSSFQSEEPEIDDGVHEKRLSKRIQTSVFKSEASGSSANNLEVDHIKDNVETKRVTRRHSSRLGTAKQESTLPADIAENIANERLSQRGQSARFQSEEPETAINDNVCSKRKQSSITKSEALGSSANNLEADHVKDNVETRSVTRRHSSRSGTGEPESTDPEDIAENIANKRLCIRTQSLSLKPPESGPTVNMVDIDDTRRLSIRRQPAKLKSQEHVDLVEIDDTNHILEESRAPLLESLVDTDNKKENVVSEVEVKRTSVGRPLRRAAEKVPTYKEISLKVKMRRER